MKRPQYFYYITHKDNIHSIVNRGIFSHSQLNAKNIPSTKIYDYEIICRRKEKHAPAGVSLWEYANFYVQARNPMLYRVICEKTTKNIAVLQINSNIMDRPGAFLADGNAAHQRTKFYNADSDGLNYLDEGVFEREYWNDYDDSKRKIMAEILVPSHIEVDKIMCIYVATEDVKREVAARSERVPVVVQPFMFFLPNYLKKLSDKIHLAKGDMFFSQAQTLTISVNTVGVMGKGLASRAKYQFPDVYVIYQDACQKKTLKMGKPVLYKRGSNIERALSDDPESLASTNGERWFLLFPTKRDWRNKSPIDGIVQGLQWLVKNCEKEEIQSVALPALGCGLGGLNWKDIGPLMCKYLSELPVETCIIYLPTEGQTPDKYLSPEFLMPRN